MVYLQGLSDSLKLNTVVFMLILFNTARFDNYCLCVSHFYTLNFCLI